MAQGTVSAKDETTASLWLQRGHFCAVAGLDPNRDPNAEKSGGIIRAGNDEAAKFSEQKGAKMP